MKLTPIIIFEDDNLIVLDKPSGLLVHHDGRDNEYTLTDWLLEKYPDMKGVGEPLMIRNRKEEKEIDRPGIVHRLDKDTSGVMVVAKNQETHAFLKQQFQERSVTKTYICVVWGNIKEGKGTIDVPIGKSKRDFRQWQAGSSSRGLLRDAQTSFEVLNRIQENGEYFAVCRVFPKTGRTHQIRVHMKYKHHPLVGDILYAPSKPLVLGFSRLALHAESLKISLPSGEEKTFYSELPQEFQKLL
jgi:23S rRNA pseudouridine1911/1915/1917 synthase